MQGRVALVTGSSRGIGRAIALELARYGADVVVHYLRKLSAAEEVVAKIKALGCQAIAAKANLAEPEQIDILFDTIRDRFGRCDIFVANAATGTPKNALQLTDKHWNWTMDVNGRSILHCVQRVAPLMEQEGWGRIATISSPGSRRVLPHYAAIGLSKAVVEALTRYLAVELAPKGILVNAVSPGMVETGALTAFPIDLQAALRHATERTPTGRLVTPADVAKVVAFLCSKENTMIVGQTITVDGGYQLLV